MRAALPAAVAVASAALAAATARPAAAEINVADSIEWVTADSEVVVRGTVDALATRPGPGDVVWYDVTVSVAETLKGRARRSVGFTVRHLKGDPREAWLHGSRELLLFLVAPARRADEDPGYARASLVLRPRPGAVVVLDGKQPDRVYTAGFDVVARRADILAAVRAAATGGATRAHHVEVPYDAPAFGALYGGSSVWLFVPVDAHLEQLARAWIADPDVFRREEGVGALAYFRSAANQRLIQGLLADPGHVVVTESGKPPVRRYPVRASAHQLLRQWGVAHATPLIETPEQP